GRSPQRRPRPPRAASDYAGGAEAVDLRPLQSQKTFVHLYVVLAQFWSEAMHGTRGARQLRDDAGDDQLAELRVRQTDDHVAGDEVGVGDEVTDAVHRGARHVGCLGT